MSTHQSAQTERPNATEIQRRMSMVRAEIDEDVDDVVESSKSLTDWKAYVRANPLAFTLGAVALGYFLVPNKVQYIKPDTAELVRAINKEKLVVAPKSNVSGRNSLVGSLLGMVAATATRAIATQLIAGVLASQAAPVNSNDDQTSPVRHRN